MDDKYIDRTYGEMIYSMLSEMNGALMSQARATNNNISNTQKMMLDLQNSINNLITGLKETRDKRYQEEIDQLEAQMHTLTRALEEKRVARSTISTSEKIRSVALNVVTAHEQAEQKRKSIDWIEVRNKLIVYVLGALVLAIVLYSLPQFGQWLQIVFAPK